MGVGDAVAMAGAAGVAGISGARGVEASGGAAMPMPGVGRSCIQK